MLDRRQLVFDFPVSGSFARDHFLPSDCNREAFETVLAWRHWQQPACLLVGPPGSGRSHLARIFAAEAEARVLGGAELWRLDDPLAELGAFRALAIDDADLCEEPRRLLELYNLVVQRQGRILLTAQAAPAEWPVELPDLRSRLKAALQLRIAPPDDGLLAALLVKQFRDRQLAVEPEVVHFLVGNMERTFEAARRLVAALDRLSLVARRRVTMPLARIALAELSAGERVVGE
ncbi:DnaA regulatory inactivator Hda [bacterium HR40]|nr:DnaA regulatory inactivator Hda [bacterium HR40]